MADNEEIKALERLEEKGRILREYKGKFRQMCQENKMIKGSTVMELYDKIEEVQREYERLDSRLTAMEYDIIECYFFWTNTSVSLSKCLQDTSLIFLPICRYNEGNYYRKRGVFTCVQRIILQTIL